MAAVFTLRWVPSVVGPVVPVLLRGSCVVRPWRRRQRMNLAVRLEAEAPRVPHLLMLESAFLSRYKASGAARDLYRVVSLTQQAINLCSGFDPAPPDALASNAVSLTLRFEPDGDPVDVDTALKLAWASVRDDAGVPEHASTRANILSTRYDRYGSRADLDEAIELLETSVAAAPDGSAATLLLSNLAATLLSRHETRPRAPVILRQSNGRCD
jgi:hypothetical protein